MTIDLEIVKADPTHFKAIADIWNPIIRDTLWTFNDKEKTVSDIENMISERDSLGFLNIVGINKGKVLGFASYTQFRLGTGYKKTMEHTVIIDSSARGIGAGKQLVRALERDARAKKVHSLIAGVSENNSVGLSFHESIGFHRLCVLPDVGFKFGKFLNLVLMQKKIAT